MIESLAGLSSLSWAACGLALLRLAAVQAGPLLMASALALWFPGKRDRLGRALLGFLFYFCLLTIEAWAAGGFTFFRLVIWSGGYLSAALLLFMSSRKKRDGREENSELSARSWQETALPAGVGIFLAALLAQGLFHPRFDHDPLTYQLFLAGKWLKAGRLSLAPTPFGDPSQAYGPGLVSVFYLFLIAGLKSDLLAQCGQWFFLAAALAATAGLCREMGEEKTRGWSAAFLLLACPLVVYEGRSALSDLGVAGFFAISLFFLVRAAKRGEEAELASGFLAAGLMAGCKFTALSLLPFLLPPALLSFRRERAARFLGFSGLGAAGALVFGGWWYVRNLVIAGNPVFPLRVELFGRELFPGLYGRKEMLDWFFHQEGFFNWLEVIRLNVSPGLLIGGIFFGVLSAAAAGGRLFRAGSERDDDSGDPGLKEAGRKCEQARAPRMGLLTVYLAVFPLLLDRVLWHVFPFQVERFWIPLVPVFCAVSAAGAGKTRLRLAALFLLCYAGLFLPPSRPLIGAGVWRFLWLWIPLSLAGGAAGSWLWFRVFAREALGLDTGSQQGKRAARSWLVPAAISGIGFLVLVAGAMRGYGEARVKALSRYEYGRGWLFMEQVKSPAVIAYTGANVPYPLFGSDFRNRVIYVSPGGEVSPLPHELLGEMKEIPRFKTPEPALSRLRLCPRKWAEAVRDSADYLFVMRVGRNASLNTDHTIQGWPTEEEWARSAEGLFRLIYADDFTRVYEALKKGDAEELSDECVSRPPDALSVCLGSLPSPECRKFFPLARQVIFRSLMKK